MTFELLAPYLKGFHLVLASHLNQRDSDGWKCSDKAWRKYVGSKLEDGSISADEAKDLLGPNENNGSIPPLNVNLTQHLFDDISALNSFFA
jgi:hypothetical protein